MKLRDSSGNEFRLVILRYQHPDLHEDQWDSNWLVVTGDVAASNGQRWRFSEPCVTTFELENLAEWLDGLAADGRAPSDFAFTEPNLKFAYTPWPQRALQLTLSRESAPPTATDVERQSGVTLEFRLPEGEAAALAMQIRTALSDFPVRGGAA